MNHSTQKNEISKSEAQATESQKIEASKILSHTNNLQNDNSRMIFDERNSFNKIAKTFIFVNNNHSFIENDVLLNLFFYKKFDFKRKADDGSASEIAKHVCLDITTIFVLDDFSFDYCVNCVMYYNVYS